MNINEYWENEWNERIDGHAVKCNVDKAEILLTNMSHRNFFKPKKILDIGCGPAFHSIRIVGEYPEYKDRWYGVELSSTAVKFFKRFGLQGECGSIYDFSPNGNKFDVFLLLDSLEHITDRDKLGQKIKELSQPEIVIFGNIPLYIDKHGLESGAEQVININTLSDFVKKAGCTKMDHFIYGINGHPYMLFEAKNGPMVET